MGTLPRAKTTVQDTATAKAAGQDLICVISPVPTSADHVPRLFGSASAIYAQHGYSEGVEYAALHAEQTGLPILFVGAPIVTSGAISNLVTSGNSGTSVVTVTAGSGGVRGEHEGVLVVEAGGTIGANQIILGLSLDGGRGYRRVRLGTGNSYTLPFVNASVGFGAGALVTGDTIATWKGSAPRTDATAIATARANLAAQLKAFRSILLIGDLQNATEANGFVTQLNAYETANDRFVYGRASVLDKTSVQTKAAWMSAIDAAFASVDAQKRIDLSAGRGRVLSPFSGWYFRRPAAWAASIREYQHDLHIPTWRKADGPTGFDLHDEDGNLAEWDDRADGAAGSAARFTTFRTWSNGPAGAFIAQSLTREVDASLLSQTHNVAVTNVGCTVVQLNAELAIGESLVLNLDGTATEDALKTIEGRVNSALEFELLRNKRGEGQRASYAVWTASRDDILNVPEAKLTGTLVLQLNGTIHSVETTVRVLSGGQQ